MRIAGRTDKKTVLSLSKKQAAHSYLYIKEWRGLCIKMQNHLPLHYSPAIIKSAAVALSTA